MRKLIVLLTTCIIALTIVSVSAESIDLSSYSNSDLLALYERIGYELAERDVYKSAEVHGGYYVAGSDIPNGRYTLEYVDHGDKDFINYYIFRSEEDYQKVNWWDSDDPHYPIVTASVWKDGGVTVKLEEGQVLYIEDGTCKITTDALTWN